MRTELGAQWESGEKERDTLEADAAGSGTIWTKRKDLNILWEAGYIFITVGITIET